MNNANLHKGSKLIAIIMAVVATSLFLIVDITPLFITAYIINLIAVIGLCLGTTYLANNLKSYPWFASFPLTVWRYLLTQLTVSAIFVISENLFGFSVNLGIFYVIHLAIGGYFSILLIMQKGGKDIIEAVDEKVKAKSVDWRMLQLDMEAVKERMPSKAQEFQAVIDALRYSLPMSSEAILPYEEKIKDSIVMLEQAANMNDEARVSELCITLLRQIKDRNNRAKITK